MFMRKMWEKIGAAVRDVYDEGNGLATAAGNQITEPAFKDGREKRQERTISRKKKLEMIVCMLGCFYMYVCKYVRGVYMCVCV